MKSSPRSPIERHLRALPKGEFPDDDRARKASEAACNLQSIRGEGDDALLASPRGRRKGSSPPLCSGLLTTYCTDEEIIFGARGFGVGCVALKLFLVLMFA